MSRHDDMRAGRGWMYDPDPAIAAEVQRYQAQRARIEAQYAIAGPEHKALYERSCSLADELHALKLLQIGKPQGTA